MSLLEARDLWIRPPGHADGPPGESQEAGGGAEAAGFTVRGASLAIEAGEWLGVTGPNGGGKTSLLLGLAGLWPAARGEVRVGGDLLAPGCPRNVRARISTVLQDPSSQLLQPTVGEEVAFAAANLDLPAATIDVERRRWMEAFGLLEMVEVDPATLPAGFQQLVLLAGALATRPAVLIADEPGAHLDPVHRPVVLRALDRERGRGMAVVWATQDETELAFADRLIEVGRPSPGVVSGASSIVLKRARDGRPASPSPTPTLPGEIIMELKVKPCALAAGPRVTATSGFEIQIPRHGVVAVTGPNGAGKSVLLAAAAGLEPIEQVNVRWMALPEHAPILVSQYPERLFFEELVRDEVSYAACARGMDGHRATQLATRCFEALNLESGLLMRHLWELSGGIRRLVEVVAALIAPASLVLLDEPTAGLDRERRMALAGMVAERGKSSALLIASQDLDWLESAGADRRPVGSLVSAVTPSLSKKTD